MKVTLVVLIIIFILFILFAYMSHAANRKVERQQFELVKNEDGFEIRFYSKAIMATVSNPRLGEERGANQNFRTLAGYIFGGNKTEKKIAMTAPVYMERDTNANKMSFVLPSAYKMTDLPDPNDTSIKLHYSDEGYYAALRFGGFAGETKIRRKEEELKQLLYKKGYEVTGSYIYLGYNAPWEIINRENEIIVKVNYAK
jgi:hypothetical protein